MDDEIPAVVQLAALEEYNTWASRLELERWTTSRQDPKQAIRELIRREYVTPTKIAQQYRYQPKGHQ